MEITLAVGVFVDVQEQTLLLPPPAKSKAKAGDDDIATLVSRMWHFPAISVQKNAELELKQFLFKLFSAKKGAAFRLEPLRKAKHTVTYREITVLPFRISVKKLPKAVSGTPEPRTVALRDVSSLTVSNLTRKVAKAAITSRSETKAGNPKRSKLTVRRHLADLPLTSNCSGRNTRHSSNGVGIRALEWSPPPREMDP